MLPSVGQIWNWRNYFESGTILRKKKWHFRRHLRKKKIESVTICCWNFELKQSIWKWRHLSIKFVKINWTMDSKQVYTNREVNPKVVLKRLSASTLNIHERVHISDHQRFDNFKAMNEHRVLEWVWIKILVLTQWLIAP